MVISKVSINKKYMLVLPFLCLLFLFYYFSGDKTAKAPASQLHSSAVFAKPPVKEASKTTAIPKVKLLQQLPLRNPFLPPQAVTKTNNPAANPTASDKFHATVPSAKPMLKGIIRNNGKLWALIEFNGKTVLYTTGDLVELYQIVAISDTNVILKNINGELSLNF